MPLVHLPAEIAARLQTVAEQSELNRLLATSEELHASTVDLLYLVQAANERLLHLGFGFEVWVSGWKLDYGFAWCDDTWQLSLRGRKLRIATPLIDAPNAEIFEGLELIPEMLSMLRHEAERRIAVVDRVRRLLSLEWGLGEEQTL